MNTFDHYLSPPIRDDGFPIYIERQEYHHNGSLFPIHWHEEIELLLILEGDFYMHCQQELVRAQKGDVVIINPNEIHHVQSDSPYTAYYCMVIDPLFIRSAFMDTIELEYLTPLWSSKLQFNHHCTTPIISKIMEDLIPFYQNKPIGYELFVKGCVLQIFSYLFRYEVMPNQRESDILLPRKQTDYVKQCLQYIHRHYMDSLSLDVLSEHLHISPFYLSHLFKEATGTSINRYLNEFRIKRSAHMLRTTTSSIADIAEQCGFEYAHYFSRQFKQIMGVSPSLFRQDSPR